MTEGEVEKAKADWRTRLDAELEAGSGYKPNKADWLDGKWAGFKSADQEEDPRRGVTGVDEKVLKDIGKQDHARCRTASAFTARCSAFLEKRAKAIDTGVGIDWATGEALAFCYADGRRTSMSAFPGRTPSAALSRSVTRCCSIRKTKAATPRSIISVSAKAITRSSTRFFRKKPCSVLSMATRLARSRIR